MKKNKGMKIYKQRKKKRGTNSQILSILGTCAVVFGLGIFGYYVVAIPVWQLVNSRGETQDTVVSDQAEVAETEVPDITTYRKMFEDLDIKVEDSGESAPVTSVVPVTEVPVTSAVSEVTSAVTTTAVTTVTAASGQTVVKGGCVWLTVPDISSIDALNAKLDSVKGCTSAAVPLKTTGGKIHYASSVSSAVASGAVVSSVSLNDIVKAITDRGMTPVAEFSTVADNIYPRTYKKSAYQFDDGYTGEWLDNKAEKGGKPWLSPFASETQEYLSALVNEITAAGIKSIICTDNYFPPFREKDLGYIGEIVKSPTRYKGLTDLVNKLNSAAGANGGKVMLYASAGDVLNSTSEVFKPEEFGSMSVVVSINMNNFPDENLHSVLTKISEKTGSMKLVPCLITDGQSADSVASLTGTFKSTGYEQYMIK